MQNKHAICILLAACTASMTAADIVKASSFGFSKDDATQCLQKAIDSGAATVIVDNTGADWVVSPIKLRSNLELVLEDNVTLRALPGAYKRLQDSLIFIGDQENVIVRGGKNSRLTMPKKDYQDPSKYTPGEWRHTIDIDGSCNVTIKDLTLDGSGGDGIAIGRGKKRIDCRNITVDNVTMINHHRLAMGVVAVDGMLVKNCRFLDTQGTAPESGVDLEPNNPDESIANVRFEDCVFSGSKATGAELVLFNHKAGSPAVSCVFERCVMKNNSSSFRIVEGTSRPCDISLIDCTLVSNTSDALYFSNMEEGNARVTLKNCTAECLAKNGPVVIFTSGKSMSKPFGTIDFGDTKFTVPSPREVFQVSELSLGLSQQLTGHPTVTCQGKTTAIDLPALIKANPAQPPEMRAFKTSDFVAADYALPKNAQGKDTPYIRLRGYAYFAQWTQPGKPVQLQFRMEDASGHPLAAKVTVFDSNGGIADQFSFLGAETKTYTLPAASHSTMRLFHVKTGANTVAIKSSAPGQAILASKRAHFYNTPVELYFIVPKDETLVKLEAYGEEPFRVAIFNEAGQKVLDTPKIISGVRVLNVKREPSKTDELWKVKTYNIVEDYHLRIGASCCPLFFTSPENAVRRIAK